MFKKHSLLVLVLPLVILLFIGILVFVYAAAKKANPIMLDERGRPVGQAMLETGK